MLLRNDNFGLDASQVTLLKQEKVPALMSADGKIAKASTYVIDSKPHGHGDVHALMHSSGTASRWAAAGIKYAAFFQDTNGLAFHTLAAMLGVSLTLGLEVNSLSIPRKAKQAVGALTRLVHQTETGREMTVNVEYNQLDPLLRATGHPEGDVNDPTTGLSPYPGNINQLVIELQPYLATLERTGGLMGEFVNPKYKDATKTAFKKPTRLECMMQDYPKALGPEARVGFTMAPAWVCYSPCKNNAADAAESIRNDVPAGSAFTAESDQYFATCELLRLLGAKVEPAAPVTFSEIVASPGPRVVLLPSTAVLPFEVRARFPTPKDVSISSRSTLVIEGDVVVHSLHLDGALKLTAAPGSRLHVRMSADAQITNQGHSLAAIPADAQGYSEADTMRGYLITVLEEEVVSTQALIAQLAASRPRGNAPSIESDAATEVIGKLRRAVSDADTDSLPAIVNVSSVDTEDAGRGSFLDHLGPDEPAPLHLSVSAVPTSSKGPEEEVKVELKEVEEFVYTGSHLLPLASYEYALPTVPEDAEASGWTACFAGLKIC